MFQKISSQPIIKEEKKKPEKKKFDLSRFRNKNYVPPPPSSLINPSTSKRKRAQKEEEELPSESPNDSDADSEPSGVDSVLDILFPLTQRTRMVNWRSLMIQRQNLNPNRTKMNEMRYLVMKRREWRTFKRIWRY